MAKMTIGPVTYEGTPEELQAIVLTFPTDESADVPSECMPKSFEDFETGDTVRLLSGGGSHPLGGYEIDGKYEVVSNDAENGEGMRYISLKGGSIHRGYATPEQLEKVADVTPKPADKLSHKGADYSLVQRKAQPGDVVVPTENNNRYFTKGKAYGPVTAPLSLIDNDGDTLGVYNSLKGRTEANVLVYEKVAVEAPKRFPQNGDIVRVTSDHYNKGFTEGAIGVVVDADSTFSPEIKVCGKRGYARVELVAEAESRADMR